MPNQETQQIIEQFQNRPTSDNIRPEVQQELQQAQEQKQQAQQAQQQARAEKMLQVGLPRLK